MAYLGGDYVPEPSPPGEAAPTPVLPENFDDLDDAAKRKAEDELKAAKRHYDYTFYTEKINPTLHRHRTEPELALCTWPLASVSGTWDEGLAFFEHCLIMICDFWYSIDPGKPCPISFTAEERAENKRAFALWRRDLEIEGLASEIGVQPDGVLDVDKLEEARRRNTEVMERFVGALPEHERADARRRWPFQDGALLTAEPCR
jgi:hypothetical protein